jgi:putative nucleotidyltransferase with HDIG domain
MKFYKAKKQRNKTKLNGENDNLNQWVAMRGWWNLMKWLLKQAQLDLMNGITASEDLFDRFGVLLLRKGQMITRNIMELIEKREIFIWTNQEDKVNESEKIKTFPKDIYINLIGSLWNIYHEGKLFRREQIEKTVMLVDTILKELEPKKIYYGCDELILDAETFKQQDYRTIVHSINVALLAAMTGISLGYRGKRLKYLTLGALLHDLGKLRVPYEILNKPGSLTDEEFAIIKQHPQMGVEILKNTRVLPSVLATIEEHHERWDGSGYPYGLKGNKIHLDAQIVAVADVFEALTADRPYRKGLPPYYALEMILAWSGKDFNPVVVQNFKESLILYPENAIVTLNTGEIGVVVAIPIEFPTRPIIRLIFDNCGRYINKEIYVDLLKDLTRFIGHVEFKEVG